MNMRPKYRHATGSVWQFPADLHLVDWLNAEGYSYDVATDLELHREGADLLRRYRVVLTGSHPEYYSERMLDAWQEYLGDGGRGMYLGSNGFYWITTWHPEKPWMIEVRKCESGSRAWQAKPGEYYHATTRRARRPLARARAGAAEAVRHGLHVRGLRPQRRLPPDARRARPARGVHARGRRDPTR